MAKYPAATCVHKLRWCDDNPDGKPALNELKTITQDPVCGMPVDEATALYDKHNGKIFYFRSFFCRNEFLASCLGTNFAEKSEGANE